MLRYVTALAIAILFAGEAVAAPAPRAGAAPDTDCAKASDHQQRTLARSGRGGGQSEGGGGGG
jgi:hypothetical protein